MLDEDEGWELTMSLISDFIAGRTPPDLYETYLSGGLFMPWADTLIEAVAASDACLDIACGTGVISRKLSDLPEVATLSSIDVAPPMIAKAKALKQEKGYATRAEFQIASALDLPFDDDVFDVALCQQGLQFFPNKVLALQEAARVLKPGGRLGAAVWTAGHDGNPAFGEFEDILARNIGSDIVPIAPFSYGDADEIRSVAEQAGLDVQAVERREMITTLPAVRDFVLFDVIFLGRPGADGALQPVIDPEDDTADELIETIIAEMTDAVRPYVQDDGTLRSLTTTHILLANSR